MTTNDAAETKKMWENLHVLADAAAMVYDEEQRERKGKAKIVSEEEDEKSKKKSFFDHVPRKIRSALRYSQPNFENLNGASASSSRLVQSSPSSCLTNSTSNMSHAVSQRSPSRSSSGFKKQKKVPLFSRTPGWLIQVMRDMNGEDPKLICEKTLIVADVNPKKSRLSIPFNLIRNDFLTAVESRIIEEDINKDEKIGVGALLVDQRTKLWGVVLKKSDLKNGSWDYSLVCGWDDVVKANGLKHGDYISLWSFRCRGILCFALVPPSQ